MSEELSRKKRVRAGHRASATRMINKASSLLEDESPNLMTLSQLKLSLQEKLDVLKHLDEEILELVDEDSVADEIEQSDGFKEQVYAIMVRVDSCGRRSRTATPPAPPSPGGGALASAGASRDVTVRLPKLSIKPFKGDLTAWTTFWDSYKAAIHENLALSEIDKFNYLRSLLQGSAHEAVSGLTLTAANYKEAVSVLEKRFGNKQQIIAKHMDILLNVETVTSSNNLKGLRHLYDTVEAQVRGLKSLGVSAESYGSLLSSVLMNKLPQELRLILSRSVGDDHWKLDCLMQALEEEVQARERAAGAPITSRKPLSCPPTSATLLTGGSETPPCCYCQQSHSPRSCDVVVSLDDRRRILREAGRCFSCLRKGHMARQCRSKSKCVHCRGRHHSSLCHQATSRASPLSASLTSTSTQNTGEPSETQHGTGMNPNAPTFKLLTPMKPHAFCMSSTQGVLLQTAQAVVFNPDNPQHSKRVRIVLDSGSQRSYITQRLQHELSLQPKGVQNMSIVTFGSRGENSQPYSIVDVCMRLRKGGMKDLRVFVVPSICEALTGHPITLCQESYAHLAGLPLADASDGSDDLEVDVLLGCDYYWSIITGKTKRGKDGPVAVQTVLGWVLSGPTGRVPFAGNSTTLATHALRVECVPQENEAALDEHLKSFWDLESFGVTLPARTVLEEFQDSIRFIDGHYEVSLPWKSSCQLLPDNREMSLCRLHGLLSRLRQDKDVFTEYDSIIKSQLKQGIVEAARPSEDMGHVHYLPHHAVIRHDKETTKLRIVYDASAKTKGPSLNNCLHSGPKFDQKIFDLLLRFRIYPVAMTADIEKAFLMVAVSEKDRDVLRFLWVDDITKSEPEPIDLRFTRVVFGVTSSPFLLNATIRHHLEKFMSTCPDLVTKLVKSFYVDDVVTGARDEEQAYTLYETSKKILHRGGFNLRKFCTNSTLLQMKIDRDENCNELTPNVASTEETEETYSSSTLCPGQYTQPGERKVLGIRWDPQTDQLIQSLEDIAGLARTLEPTKREIVSLVGKFYDPLGLLSPVVVNFKIFLQELCQERLGWDQPLTGRLLEKWQQLSSSLQQNQPFLTARCYINCTQNHSPLYKLCGFCDASLKAYGAVVYLVIETPDGCHSRIVASKTRVSPLKAQTIPRLELLSALLLSRLVATVTRALEGELTLTEPHCFTDSTVTLFWIQGVDKSWKQFVQNRVTEIRELVPPTYWAHCARQNNPADLPSRGLAPCELSDSQLWWKGPDWLENSDLGDGNSEATMPEECERELKVDRGEVSHGLLVASPSPGIGQLMKCEDFSSLRRLIGVTAIILKFCDIMLLHIHKDVVYTHADQISRARALWLAESQKPLEGNKNFHLWRIQFNLFQDEKKLWRCWGRIQNANPSKVSVDDVVLIHSSEQPRTFWRLGRVKELLVGKDGEVRGAVLRVSGGRKPTVLQRPIQLLYPLEIPPSHPKRPEHTVETNAESQTVSRGPIEEPRLLDKSDGPTTPQRPRRAAATMARDRLMAHALSED